MVESTEDFGLPDRARFRRFDGPRHWTLLLQPEMRPTLIVVRDVIGQHSVQVPLIEHDYVVEKFST